MSSKLQLLLAVLAAAYIATVSCEGCTYPEWGQKIGLAFTWQTIKLPPGKPDVEVKVPMPESCKTVNGIFPKVCDYDSTPEAYFFTYDVLKVHRTGNLLSPGEVEFVYYCNSEKLHVDRLD